MAMHTDIDQQGTCRSITYINGINLRAHLIVMCTTRTTQTTALIDRPVSSNNGSLMCNSAVETVI